MIRDVEVAKRYTVTWACQAYDAIRCTENTRRTDIVMDPSSSTETATLPPEWMRVGDGDGTEVEGAKKHVEQVLRARRKWYRFLMCGARDEDFEEGSSKAKDTEVAPEVTTFSVPGATPAREDGPVDIDFGDGRGTVDELGKEDVYRWAILYENQRGLTIFSTAYYSSRSLLPRDPPSFALPDPGDSPPHVHTHAPPNVTMETYPLPDPTWRWVSKSWLVDMRGEGEVQHDGFEYNWFFRRRDWRAHAGFLGAGSWVRRRRWVRLMMRPSDARLAAEAVVDKLGQEYRESEGTETVSEGGDTRVWRGDEGDWTRIRRTMRALGRDGPMLDLWREWLTDMLEGKERRVNHGRTATMDTFVQETFEIQPGEIVGKDAVWNERPQREWVLAVLRHHGHDLRVYFVFPDSRVQLRELLTQAGLAQDVFSDAAKVVIEREKKDAKFARLVIFRNARDAINCLSSSLSWISSMSSRSLSAATSRLRLSPTYSPIIRALLPSPRHVSPRPFALSIPSRSLQTAVQFSRKPIKQSKPIPSLTSRPLSPPVPSNKDLPKARTFVWDYIKSHYLPQNANTLPLVDWNNPKNTIIPKDGGKKPTILLMEAKRRGKAPWHRAIITTQEGIRGIGDAPTSHEAANLASSMVLFQYLPLGLVRQANSKYIRAL
ncbi:hypothetical protein M422DRAFT_71733 [Sphaerobolus stellatus SS14]|uniref:TECPR1-like DysF domain-containing protein n=1 Tax=Sphaerobolus stellatus (strain SS14) TaxID=990650 RepID=A0A0C9UNZ4_SPHS4|nr:hypothetical protein M422DRAFT_71733 [Sphaerobolus stellatus SS14]